MGILIARRRTGVGGIRLKGMIDIRQYPLPRIYCSRNSAQVAWWHGDLAAYSRLKPLMVTPSSTKCQGHRDFCFRLVRDWPRDREVSTIKTAYQIPRLLWPLNNLLFGTLHIHLPSDARIWLSVVEGLRSTKPHTGGSDNQLLEVAVFIKSGIFQVPPNIYEWVNDEWTYHMRDSSSNKMSG